MTQNPSTPPSDEGSADPKQWPAPQAWPAPEPWQSGTVQRAEPASAVDPQQQATPATAPTAGSEQAPTDESTVVVVPDPSDESSAGEPEQGGQDDDRAAADDEDAAAGGEPEDDARPGVAGDVEASEAPAQGPDTWGEGGREWKPPVLDEPGPGARPGVADDVAASEAPAHGADTWGGGGQEWKPPVLDQPAAPPVPVEEVRPAVVSGGWAAPGGPGPYGVPLPPPPQAPPPPVPQMPHPHQMPPMHHGYPPPTWQQQQHYRPPQGPQPVSYPPPVRFEHVPGEKFFLAILPVPKMVSGVGVGALVAGIGSILVSGAVWCFGLTGAADGWGGLVSGAFFVLSIVLGIAGVVLGLLALRQIRRSHGGVTGRGYAISGIACGGTGLLLATLGLAVALLLSGSAP